MLEQSLMHIHDAPANIIVGCPAELFDLLVEDYGQEEAIRMCLVNNTQAPVFARINPLKVRSRAEFVKHMSEKYGPQTAETQEKMEEMDKQQQHGLKEARKIMGLEADGITLCKHSSLGVKFSKRHNFRELEEYKNGWFEIQDEASQVVSQLVEAKPSQQVMDYCCGAGGKTLGFAHRMEGKGMIHMVDVRSEILQEAKKRLRRAGIQNIMPMDTEHPHLPKLTAKMKWLLVDVPCTGTGTVRRNPELRLKVNRAWVDRLIKEQRTIFDTAIKYLGKGGHVIYATCSVLNRENEYQIAHFTKRYNLSVVKTYKVLPEAGEHDGMFACVMVRK
jgi:16S rRNA (cytosine967-C5)-methyltransferase